ncbi:MAG: AarF/UbiB family protein [Pirellulales bacterium]
MKIGSIPQIYRNLRRWQEIIVVLRRYGLADWLSKIKVDFIRDWLKDPQGVPLASYSRETRIRMALTDLGPTFIKLGQVLSLRPDLVGPDLATELQQLQTQVPADSYDLVRAKVESELKAPIEVLFESFEEKPIASASIGQVHLATLHDGTSVVVKVQHHDIRKTVQEDLEVLAGLAVLAERIPEIAAWQPRTLVDQLSKSLHRELSFNRELNNLLMFQAELKTFPGLHIPTPFADLSSAQVLTMERIEGRRISQIDSLADRRDLDADLREWNEHTAKKAAELYMEMIFRLGTYHADPHPGNILVCNDGRLGLLDFGMVGRIDDKLRESIEEMLLAVSNRDSALLTSLIKRVGKVPLKLDTSNLSIDVAELIATYGSQPLERFDLAGALNDVTDILHRHRIILPPQTSMLIRTLIVLEGTLHQLNPHFSLLEVMQPMFRKMWFRRLLPQRQVRRLRRMYVELEGLVEKLPSQISGLLELVQEGRLDVHLSHRGLNPSINRLVLGMLTSSLFLGSSVLLAYKVPPVLFTELGPLGLKDLSVLGILGFAMSILVSLRLILAISKSGHLDPVNEEDLT